MRFNIQQYRCIGAPKAAAAAAARGPEPRRSTTGMRNVSPLVCCPVYNQHMPLVQVAIQPPTIPLHRRPASGIVCGCAGVSDAAPNSRHVDVSALVWCSVYTEHMPLIKLSSHPHVSAASPPRKRHRLRLRGVQRRGAQTQPMQMVSALVVSCLLSAHAAHQALKSPPQLRCIGAPQAASAAAARGPTTRRSTAGMRNVSALV